MIKGTNIKDRLQQARDKNSSGEQILQEVYRVLQEDQRREDDIIKELKSPQVPTPRNAFDIELLATDRIYHISQIKEICIDYRLRFLDTKYFKNDIPREGLQKIKALEKEHNTQLRGFKIIAPSKLFKLENPDDPLLFAPIGNGYFYLIHHWGKDLHPLRKLWAWSFKKFENLILTTVLVSALLSYLVPTFIFGNELTNVQYLLIFFFTFKSIASIVLYVAFAKGKNFNEVIWNSKFF